MQSSAAGRKAAEAQPRAQSPAAGRPGSNTHRRRLGMGTRAWARGTPCTRRAWSTCSLLGRRGGCQTPAGARRVVQRVLLLPAQGRKGLPGEERSYGRFQPRSQQQECPRLQAPTHSQAVTPGQPAGAAPHAPGACPEPQEQP